MTFAKQGLLADWQEILFLCPLVLTFLNFRNADVLLLINVCSNISKPFSAEVLHLCCACYGSCVHNSNYCNCTKELFISFNYFMLTSHRFRLAAAD